MSSSTHEIVAPLLLAIALVLGGRNYWVVRYSCVFATSYNFRYSIKHLILTIDIRRNCWAEAGRDQV